MAPLAVMNGAGQLVYIDVISGDGTLASPYKLAHGITGTPDVRQAHLDPTKDGVNIGRWAGVDVVEVDGRPEMAAVLYNPVNQIYYRPLANYLYTAIASGTRAATTANSAAVGTAWQYNPNLRACKLTLKLKTKPATGTLTVRLLRALVPDGSIWEVAASATAVSIVDDYEYLFARDAAAIGDVVPFKVHLPAYFRPEVIHELATDAWEYELLMEVLG